MTEETAKPNELPLAEIGSGVAPFIYFDGVPTFGANHGVANLTLEAVTFISREGQVVATRTVVAHLRTSGPGLASLKAAIEGIELLAANQPSGPAN